MRHDDHDDVPQHPAVLTPAEFRLTRRSALRRLGGAGVGLASLGSLGAAAGAPDPAYAASCTLSRELIEGPYYLDLRKVRQNITEGKAGLRLDLRIRVVNGATCRAMPNVAVDLWHADAYGTYSGFAAEATAGETFLRGIQLTDASGLARVRTIYPGWYEGRATHIHVPCHVGGRAGSTYAGGRDAHTGQLFFHDATTDKVAKLAPYASRRIARVRNTDDAIYNQAGSGSVVRLTRRSAALRSGLVATVTLAIHPS